MRYKISTYPLLDGHLVTIATYSDDDEWERLDLWTFEIAYEDLKVNDLQHLLEVLHMRVSEVTP